ncbi:MAG TPA: KEOPS complex kinase/ATPase Bud32 [Candidatus Nanoarchaeia archaeon]|nr:KEOPS complex kinase/ATPase Bud32 [Candidatus Nanoarchaeia archaeon]
MKTLIAQGAEAKIFLEGKNIVKNRFPKAYRIKEIDDKLRSARTRREAKVLQKLEELRFPAPRLIKSDERENLIIEKLDGKLLKDVLEQSDYKKICSELGKKIAILHNNLIIHGDLTTSNIILNKELYFIDFGLSFFSEKSEDRAVDLHLLKEALESRHYRIWKECIASVIESYKKEAKNSSMTLKKLSAVEQRGRYRAKKGG